MGVFPCPLPCNKLRNDPNSDQFHHVHPHSSDTSSSSSSSSSLLSQPSLPSVPSLTPPSSLQEQAPNARSQILATLKGHSSHVFSLALAGKHLYSGSSDGEIRAWTHVFSPQDPTVVLNLVAQGNSAVKSIVVLGDKLFAAHHDHKIRVWKIDNDEKNYKCIATLPTLNDRCARLFSAKNYVQVRRHKKCTWVHHVDAVSALALSKDGSLLYSVSWDRTMKVWRTSDYKCLESIWNAHDDAINAVALSNDGFIYTGSADKKIKVWKKHEGDKKHSLVATLEKHKSAVNALALSTDGSVLYSGACDRSIIVWDKDGGGGGHMVVSGALRGHSKAILCLTVVSDLVCSGSADKTVRVWRRRPVGNSYSCLAVLEGHKGPLKCLTAAPHDYHARDDPSPTSTTTGTSYLVYGGSLDCELRVWKIWVPLI